MHRQYQFLDLYKRQKNMQSDYQLAKHWGVSTATVSQYRKGRLHLPIALCLDIANVCCFHPLEVILALEYYKAKEEHREIIKDVYFIATIVSAPERMSARAFSRKFYKRRKY